MSIGGYLALVSNLPTNRYIVTCMNIFRQLNIVHYQISIAWDDIHRCR